MLSPRDWFHFSRAAQGARNMARLRAEHDQLYGGMGSRKQHWPVSKYVMSVGLLGIVLGGGCLMVGYVSSITWWLLLIGLPLFLVGLFLAIVESLLDIRRER